MTMDTVRSNWRPSTRLGWWAIWLGATFVVMWIINTFVFVFMPTFSDAA